jgi:alpha,alpha-trehalose-phosphate synthase [UDP-forming]
MLEITPNETNGKIVLGDQEPGRLLVLSNRAPIRIVSEGGRRRIEPTVGGVGATFLRLLERHGGLWIAWSGSKTALAPLRMPPDEPRFSMVFPPLTERDIAYYYWGMCNRGLWPLMHLMPQNCHFRSQHWNSYKSVNERFAEMTAVHATADDRVWIQDFHLALVPALLRQRRPALPIGLFWHVPFPPESFFRIFPWRRELLEGMLGSDLIGFHTAGYADHFVDCCARICGLQVDRAERLVSFAGRTVSVQAFPLGIPADYFAQLAGSSGVQARVRRIRAALNSPIVILGVDRLDYTKGILERVEGFERFLELNPAYHKRVAFVQIAVPSRTKVDDYARLKRQLDESVGRVVGRFSSEGWVPIRYLYTQFGAEELVSYYQAADVALLTPLRDGMNLVAKEYIAARNDDRGVLILSEFAGAAEELEEALLVNPYDMDAIASSLRHALTMSAAERAARMNALRARVHGNNLEHWSQNFLGMLERRGALGRYVSSIS